jgi:hypothetical protein
VLLGVPGPYSALKRTTGSYWTLGREDVTIRVGGSIVTVHTCTDGAWLARTVVFGPMEHSGRPPVNDCPAVDALKAKLGLRTDTELATHFGVTPGRVSQVRKLPRLPAGWAGA